MKNSPSPDMDVPGREIRVWAMVRQSLAVLFRHVVPFVLLAGSVAWTVGMVLFLTGLAPFLVMGDLALRRLDFAALFFRQVASVTLHAASRVAVDAVIATAVWTELNGRRLTLTGSLRAVAKATPCILRRPFYLLVSRVSAVAVLRALFYLPYHAVVILLLTSASETELQTAWFIALSFAATLLDALIDSRLLMLIPVATVERRGVLDSFRRCWRLTTRHWTRIFFVLVLAGCFPAALNWSASTSFKGAAHYIETRDLKLLAPAVVFLKGGLIRAWWAVVAVVCYRRVCVANGEIAPVEASVPPKTARD